MEQEINIKEEIIKLIGDNYFYQEKTYEKDLEMVGNFLILWNMFEGMYDNQYRTKVDKDHKENIIQKCIEKVDKLNFSRELLDDALLYFRSRYIETEETNKLFEKLKLENSCKGLCEKVLKNESDIKEGDRLKCVMHIVRRYRNNLFHGIKEIPLKDQKTNFEISYKILIELIKNYNSDLFLNKEEQ